ncbi:hypothetical protein P4C99_17520 [Pontiellaceae bacterium B1224]|nr:hypothetical protein [Pontiellaceae bacterium B1224]
MNLSELTKEKKQYLILGIVGGVAILAAIGFGVNFSFSSLAASKAELAELTEKINRAERTLSGTGKTMDGLEEAVSRLKGYLDFIPPEQNYYSWATELVYSKGRKAGLEIESVDEIRVSGGNKSIPDDPVYFETYSLRITARGGYAQTKAFLKDIETNLPLVRFSGLEVSKSNDLALHDIQIIIQWPFKLNRITKLWEDQPIRKKAMVAAAKPEPASVPQVEQPAPAVVEPKSAPLPTPPESKPEPVVVKAEPEPAPKRVVVEPAAEKPAPVVVQAKPASRPTPPERKPEPVVVKAEPVPAPKPPVVVPAPVVEKPAPVVVESKPAPMPTPPESKPEPVVVKAEPVPTPKPDVVVPAPVVEEPAPVVVESEPAPDTEPEEAHELESILASIDPVQKSPAPETPTPVVVESEPTPVSAPEETYELESILASIDPVQESPAPETPEPEVQEEENDMSALLASLGSHGSDTLEPVPVVEPPAVQDDLAAYVQELAESAPVQSAPEPVEMIAPVEVPDADGAIRYVSSSKSAKIIEELLIKGKPKASASLGSFLDGLVEDINDKH